MTGAPWIARWRGQRWGSASTRQAAMNLLDHTPYRAGWCEVVHAATGETWERRQGPWSRIVAAKAPA